MEKIPWRREWQPIPVFLPGKFCGQRWLAGYGSWGCKQSNMTQQLSTYISNQLVKRDLEKLEINWKYVLLPWKSLFAVSLQQPKWSLKSPYPLPVVASWKDLCCALVPRFWLLKLFSTKRNQGSLEGSVQISRSVVSNSLRPHES